MSEPMQAVILCGGLGTRMGERTRDVPKSMLPFAGVPILEYQVRQLRACGVRRVLMLCGHKAEVIRRHFADGAAFGVELDYVVEPQPLGTAGAFPLAAARLADEFLVVYGDVIFDVDLDRFREAHRRFGGAGTLLVHPNDHPHDSDLLALDETARIVRMHPKPHDPAGFFPNLSNAGLYILKRELVARIAPGRKQDFGREVFPQLVREGALRLFGYNTSEYVKDIGTPDRLQAVEADYRNGVVQRRNLRQAQRAVFLDRDGVINVYDGFITRPEQIRLLDGSAEAIRRLNRAGWLALVVTNQAVIARGDVDFAALDAIHNKVETLLARAGAFLNRIYVCPHHPDKGFPGERPEYKVRCDCRKPATGLLRRAEADYHVDLSKSFLIGDTTRDIQCGRNAGVFTIGVKTGLALEDGKFPVAPDRVCRDLGEAVSSILGEST